jgi:uncharacterized membrane protein YdjX (TVP38/TMEM64 family)
MDLKEYKKEIAVLSFMLVLFVLVSYFSQAYFETIIHHLDAYTFSGMLFYVAGATLTTVIAPLSFLPIMPIAVMLWGSFLTAVLSILAWSLGAGIAFVIARKFGRPLVLKLLGEKKMQFAATILPRKRLFLAIVFLRMVLPVDLLSYALGLFVDMSFSRYMLATILGLTPFAFAFAYLADVGVWFQIIGVSVCGILVIISTPYIIKRYKTLFLNQE